MGRYWEGRLESDARTGQLPDAWSSFLRNPYRFHMVWCLSQSGIRLWCWQKASLPKSMKKRCPSSNIRSTALVLSQPYPMKSSSSSMPPTPMMVSRGMAAQFHSCRAGWRAFRTSLPMLSDPNGTGDVQR